VSEPDELDAVADELVARGLGEGVDFFVSGRSPVDLSSEYVGLRRRDDGSYEVWYRGDWGKDKTLVETPDFDVARQRFVDEAVTLAEGRWGRKVHR
jgi:hypothetical protein